MLEAAAEAPRYDLLLRGGTVVTEEGMWRADVAVAGGRIAALFAAEGDGRRRGARERGGADEAAARKILDVTGKYVFPGFIDMHTHFNLHVGGGVHSSDDFHDGTRAAALGGVCTVVDFAQREEYHSTLQDAYLERVREAEGASWCNFALHMVVRGGDAASHAAGRELCALIHEHGCTTFKFFTAYTARGLGTDDGPLLSALRLLAREGGAALVHCENESIIEESTRLLESREASPLTPRHLEATRPVECEVEAALRAALFASVSGVRLHVVHVSSGTAAFALHDFRTDPPAGLRTPLLTFETCPQYLVLDSSFLQREDGHLFTCCPPLRPACEVEALRSALAAGMIDCIATDHCPFPSSLKERGARDLSAGYYGLASVEVSAALIHHYAVRSGLMDLPRMAALMSANPARICGLYPERGTLRPGSAADITIFDPTIEKDASDPTVLHMNVDYAQYPVGRLKGWPWGTVISGVPVVVGGRLIPVSPPGRHLKRNPFPRSAR